MRRRKIVYLIVLLPQSCISLQISRPWTTRHWCQSIQNPQWPFAYSKYLGHIEEKKGRVSSNAQDMRHVCRAEGVQSKCHVCEDILCGTGKNTTCHFQIQGVNWRDMSTNIPTVSDVPWAVGGRHRYDFGGNSTTHVCLYLSNDGICQTNFAQDYSNCPLRCWGYHSTFTADKYNYYSSPTRSYHNQYTQTKRLYHRITQWNNQSDVVEFEDRVNATSWTFPLPSITWEYPKFANKDKPQNPKVHGNWSLLSQGATFTLAGSQKGEKGFKDGESQSARFNHPEGVAVDHQGNVFVADTGNHAIRFITPTGTVTTIAGTGVPGYKNSKYQGDVAQFSYPSAIAYWRDWQQSRQPDPNDPDSFIEINGQGRQILFVADTGNHCIRKITANNNKNDDNIWNNVTVTCFSGPCIGIDKNLGPGYVDGERHDAKFDSPKGLTVSNKGLIYVADTNNHVIRQIDRLGNVKTLPSNLFRTKSKVNIFDPQELSAPFLVDVNGEKEQLFLNPIFTFPSDVALSTSEDAILVTDRHRLSMINLTSGLVSTVAGDKKEGENDGQGREALFNKPMSVSVTSDGILYIADAVSCRIRRVSSPKLIAHQITCYDTLSSLFRPSGCSAYNAPTDEYGIKVTPVEGNIYYNFYARKFYDKNFGHGYFGRGLKDCVGSHPIDKLDKRFWNVTSSFYPFNENLVIDDGHVRIREDPNTGSVLKVSCPAFCDYDLSISFQDDSENYEKKTDNYYLENSSVCGAAIHSGLIEKNSSMILDVIIQNSNEVKDENIFLITLNNEIQLLNFSDDINRVFRVTKSSIDMGVQTIAGAPTSMLGDACGYHDSLPPQEAKFSTPTGIATFSNNSLNDHKDFLYISDRNNHVIRAMTATCAFPCENGGRCIGPDVCHCQGGWQGLDCTRPKCTSPCSKRQVCVAPDVCSCVPGYTGKYCNIATCVQICQNGGKCFAPDTCSCGQGWFDPNCTTPVCAQTCGNGGNCTGPNTCSCPMEWTGSDCRTPVCEQTCLNGGWCVAPNTCSCPPQYSGFDCSAPVCHQGYFVPFSINLEVQRKKEKFYWLQYEPCMYSEWCKETHGFDCAQDKRILYPLQIKYGSKWRFKTGKKREPQLCEKIELRAWVTSPFQYLRATNSSRTSYHRYTPKTPYNYISRPRQVWNAHIEPERTNTQPWKFLVDRQVAMVTLYNVTQGIYVCANGGVCVEPETCECAPGWIGFDCRTPVCEQGYYEADQKEFVRGTNLKEEFKSFEEFLGNNTYRLDSHFDKGRGYSNPIRTVWWEKFLDEGIIHRFPVQIGGKEYLAKDGFGQGGYSCSIRSVTKWENYRKEFLHEHPNYYSRYMDKVIEMDGHQYSQWKGMGWDPVHKKSRKNEFGLKEFLANFWKNFKNYQINGIHGSNISDERFLYTDQGYRRNGSWELSGEKWKKGSCIIEFKRICDKSVNALDLEAKPNGGLDVIVYDLLVQDTDLAFRPRITYDDKKSYPLGTWKQNNGECIDQVVRGCFNNGTCVGPNECKCAVGWTGFDCSIPLCDQLCFHNGNCTHPNTCTCERGWTGHDCSIPVCAQECNNFGICVAPDTCKCKQWPNQWRDNRIGGGVPLYQKPNGDPQMTGWTGYDCSTPICVQAQRFRRNVDIQANNHVLNKLLVPLGGHGKNGQLECDNVRCPEYNKMVTMNDGKSFQTGCGYDPIETGCCFNYSHLISSERGFKCFKCNDDDLIMYEHTVECSNDNIQSWDYSNEHDVPPIFRDDEGLILICGRKHNPGARQEDYFVSKVPNARLAFSNNNWMSNFTSDHFLCNRHKWEQGNFKDSVGLSNESVIESDRGLSGGRQIRINFKNYVKNVSSSFNDPIWYIGPPIEGEGIFECYNLGSCIGPDVCSCSDGWSGFDCRIPLCRHKQSSGRVVGCQNGGICKGKDDCKCIQTLSILWKHHDNVERDLTGWSGTDCSMPICVQGYFDPFCNISYAPGGEGCFKCANDGICIAPDTCKCAKGWTGFDCRTPICEVVADDVTRKQLMTVDEEKVKAFEKDPCGMKDFHKPELLNDFEYARGICTLPNQCTCLCKKSYNKYLCEQEGGDYCKTPFQDPLVNRRNVLKPNEIFGTRDCWSGYEGIVAEDNDFYRSCHLTIFEPDYMIRHTIGLAFWGCILILIGISLFIYTRWNLQKRELREKIERRKSLRQVNDLIVGGRSDAVTHRSSHRLDNCAGSSTVRSGDISIFTHRSIMKRAEKGKKE